MSVFKHPLEQELNSAYNEIRRLQQALLAQQAPTLAEAEAEIKRLKALAQEFMDAKHEAQHQIRKLQQEVVHLQHGCVGCCG